MKPEEFIQKWRNNTSSERAASQHHFLDLCDLLEVPKPRDPGFDTKDYDFELPVPKEDGGTGFADVFKRGSFAWEYKRNKKSLVAAYKQVRDYADALDSPPLLIVSDMQEIQVHTNFTNEVKQVHTIQLAELNDPTVRRTLKWAFVDPERLRPEKTLEIVTEEAAASIGVLATKLRAQGYEPRRVAHFLNKIVFCLYAEDIELLPDYIFTEILEECSKNTDLFERMIGQLFVAMREEGGLFGTTPIPWFDGGLFSDDDVLPLGFYEIKDLLAASHLDWSAIEPSIFGTLFERGLDPARRKEMASLFDAQANSIETSASKDLFADIGGKAVGVHYTDADKIMKIVEPVVLQPLRAEWSEVKTKIAELQKNNEKEALKTYLAFRKRLGDYRVLDPACGSGNFLYLALRNLKDLDLLVQKEAVALGLPTDDQRVTPDAIIGIEVNPYAAELAQVTIWIGELQWQLENGFGITRVPILGNLASISGRDALINPDGTIANWPDADAIIGNPPFLGSYRFIGLLGEEHTSKLRSAYVDLLPGTIDLVVYWFAKAWQLVEENRSQRVGLVATNSIRGGANRTVLQKICNGGRIFNAWGDEPWVIDGAAVRVSIVCFENSEGHEAPTLNGEPVKQIYSDLTSSFADIDVSTAIKLDENKGFSFLGTKKGGPFDFDGSIARGFLRAPTNPNGRPNSDVIHRRFAGADMTRRPSDKWIIDFGHDVSLEDAALYEVPFEYILEHVKPVRDKNRRKWRREHYWLHSETAPGLRENISGLSRFIGTPRVSKHRVFVWLDRNASIDDGAVAITRDDDVTFGILHSRFHELWALRLGTSLEDRPRYTPSTTFDTFPFPEGLTPNIPAAVFSDDPRAQQIADISKKLNELRNNWLNPPDLVRSEPEVVEGYPDRILPINEKAATELKKRTLTNLYNQRPAWLDNAHRELDEAVAAAYGWPAGLEDDEILKRLLDLNLERAKEQSA